VVNRVIPDPQHEDMIYITTFGGGVGTVRRWVTPARWMRLPRRWRRIDDSDISTRLSFRAERGICSRLEVKELQIPRAKSGRSE